MRICLRVVILTLLSVVFCSGSLVRTISGNPENLEAGAGPSRTGVNAVRTQRSIPQTINVTQGEDLQAALDSAIAGDVIKLEAGATFTGNFSLPNKEGSDWITIRSSADDSELPSPDTRLNPSYANLLPRIISPNSAPALRAEAGAHNYRMLGLEFTIAADVMLNYGVVRLGEGDEKDAALLPRDLVIDRCYIHGHPMADVSRGIALNSASTEVINSRISEIHGIGFDTQAIAGWNGPGPFKINNNYLEASGENVMFGGADPSIPELVPSDIEFRLNHCAKPLSWKDGILARPEGVVASGAVAFGKLTPTATYYYRISARGRAGYSSVATSVASDEVTLTLAPDQTSASIAWNPIERATEYYVYRTSDNPSSTSRTWVLEKTSSPSLNDLGESTAVDSRPPESATRWSVKNLFELKNARRVLIDGNLFENNWVDAQSGFAIQFTVRNQDGRAAWSAVEDVTFTNNVLRHSAGGINLLGRDYNHPSQQVSRVQIRDNLFDDLGGARWGGNGRFLQITETVDVKVDHNTVFQTGNIITAYGVPNQKFTFTNNIAVHNEYGIIGDGAGVGKNTLDQYFPAHSLKKNVIVGGSGDRYPQKNFYPARIDDVGFVDRAGGNYRLADTSPYKNAGTKQKAVGADFALLESISTRALTGSP
jgi:hypothetical protein